ncbi:MAG: DNA sulfur modification protein DndD [Oscillatoriales cyanobacterium RM2_1_1]|nr:DNA sulfur modification protein DndD [Oscillatoriales cyanobacterium SM2_3_0]NJO44451.1 DNA sulfur modification protein DndD [Oscillatoriales cyanobacterium RM2_1_1]
MQFQSLTLENFAQYRDRQVIDLLPMDQRPVVLFGGQNGHGKTTLLDAIRLALYGQRANCSTRGKLSYSKFLSQCVHRHTPDQPTVLELVLRQPDDHEFRIHRTWSMGDSRDILTLFRNEWEDVALTRTWDEYIETLFPLGISNLFLFDGEQVKELAEQEELPAEVIGAIKTLLGLALPDLLSNDLDILLSKKSRDEANSQQQKKFQDIEQHLNELQAQKSKFKQTGASLENSLHFAEKNLHQAQAQWLAEGGRIAAEKAQLEAQFKHLTFLETQHQQTLRELAAGALPLSLIQPLLKQAQAQAQQEIYHQKFTVAQELIRERDQALLSFLQTLKLKPKQFEQIQTFLQISETNPTDSNAWLKVEMDVLPEFNQALQTLPDLVQQGYKYLEYLAEIQAEIEVVQQQLAKVPSEEHHEKLQANIDIAQAELVQFRAKKEQTLHHLEQIRKEIEGTHKELLDYGKQAIDQEKHQYFLQSVQQVQTTLAEFKTRLKSRKLNQLETQVTQCFLYLLHKSNLIHRVEIDQETFNLSLFDFEGEPVPKNRLSAGEKQLLAIALLWGLVRASGRNLPIAIDTPLGRLDSSHRQNLIKKYFPTASHQMILLSTDTEIGSGEVQQLRKEEAISYEYLLKYDIHQRQTVVKKGYFW